eukprot:692728-Rhodomonas_salina.6
MGMALLPGGSGARERAAETASAPGQLTITCLVTCVAICMPCHVCGEGYGPRKVLRGEVVTEGVWWYQDMGTAADEMEAMHNQ